MLKARDIMTTDLITISQDTDIVQATRILLQRHVNGVPVVDSTGHLKGILCQSDLVAQQKKMPIPSLFAFLDGFIPTSSMKQMEKKIQKIAATTVADAMTPNPATVSPDTDIDAIATLMVDQNFHTIPVVDGDKLVGIIGKEDILRTLMPKTDP